MDSEKQALNFQETEFFGTSKKLLNQNYNRSRKSKKQLQNLSKSEEADSCKARDLQYTELAQRMATLKSLKSLANELWIKKQIAKGADHKELTLSDGSSIVKFKKIRQ